MKKLFSYRFFIIFFLILSSLIFALGIKKIIFYKESHLKNENQIISATKTSSINESEDSFNQIKHQFPKNIKDIYGNEISFSDNYLKKKLLINIWATWCAPCIKELPSLSKLSENEKDHVFIVAISSELKENVKEFIKKSFPDLNSRLKLINLERDELQKYFPFRAIPTTYFFSKKYQLIEKIYGERDWNKKFWRDKIKKQTE